MVMCIATIAATAMAQDEPRFALVASLPSPTVSFQWELSEKFALRFDGSYRYQNESTEPFESSIGGDLEHVYTSGVTTQVIFIAVSGDSRTLSTTQSGTFGVAGIYTLYRNDRLRLYAAPRISVAWSRQEFTTTLPPIQTLSGPLRGSSITETLTESRTSPGAGAAFGAAGNIHRHFALFGEVGVSYWRNNSPGPGTSVSPFGRSESKSTTLGTLAMAGVMLLF